MTVCSGVSDEVSSQIEREIESALEPRRFIAEGACFAFVSALHEVESKIAELERAEPGRAALLYEVFLAGCYEKGNELDDSADHFAPFVQSLYCGWVRARQNSGADREETARKLLDWMDTDPFAYSNELENEAVKIFDEPGLGAFKVVALERFETVIKGDADTEEGKRKRDYEAGRFIEMLRAVYREGRNVAEYQAFVERVGITAGDCRTLAEMCSAEGRTEDAWSWVERGLAIAKDSEWGAEYHLVKLRRALLKEFGRTEELLQEVWNAYLKSPGKYRYEELMEYVPDAEREIWHEKAMDAASKGDLREAIDLFLKTEEIERLARRLRRIGNEKLENMSHYTTEPAAKVLEGIHPDLAARLWRAQGMRIIKARKSKYYDAALSNFEKARLCYEAAGLSSEWRQVVDDVLADHKRKSGFIAGFKEIADGQKFVPTPTFLERAKMHWESRKWE